MKAIRVEDLYKGMLVYDLMVGGRALRVKDWRVWQVPREDNDQIREEYVHVTFDGTWDVFPGGVRQSEEPLTCIDARTDFLCQCIEPLMDDYARRKISEDIRMERETDGKASGTVADGKASGTVETARQQHTGQVSCSAMMSDMISAI